MLLWYNYYSTITFSAIFEKKTDCSLLRFFLKRNIRAYFGRDNSTHWRMWRVPKLIYIKQFTKPSLVSINMNHELSRLCKYLVIIIRVFISNYIQLEVTYRDNNDATCIHSVSSPCRAFPLSNIAESYLVRIQWTL